MFSSQIVRLEIVEPSSGPLFPCFPRKWYALKLSNPRCRLFPCFPHKYYVLKLSNPQLAHFFHLSIANGTLYNCRTLKWPNLSMFPSQMVHLKIVEPSSFPTFSMFLSQMVRLKIIEPSSGPLFPCFPRKYYFLKLSNRQVSQFFHVSIPNGTP